jgi:hypothetical protein
MNCFKCNNYTSNPKFCSRSCAISFNNAKKPKRVRTLKCCKCKDVLIISGRSYCESCLKARFAWQTVTLGDYLQIRVSRNRYSATIRWRARQAMESAAVPRVCKVCNYSIYVECCHIKPVASFSPTAKIAEVNHLSNLIYLCPNHHKELDAGRLILANP